MGVVNITAILEYGRGAGVLRKHGVVGPKDAAGAQQAATIRVMAKKAAPGWSSWDCEPRRYDGRWLEL